MFNKIRELTYSNERSLPERRFLLASIVGCAAILAVLLSVITTQQSVIFAIVLVVSFLVMAGVIAYTLRSKKILLGSSIIIIMSNLFILPVGYLLGGGLHSGAPLWFVIGIVFIFVLFRGPHFWVFLVMSFISFGVAIYFSETRPELVVPLQEGYSSFLDAYIAIVCVSVLCGALLVFQSTVLEKELKRAEEQATEIEKLNTAQNTFFSSMSHEIRTPISTIIGLNEMTMRETYLPEEVLDNTLNIQNASKMLLSLINDLLDMSKIQSGRMEIVPAQYETSRMLSEMTNLHWNRANEKGLHFDIQVGENMPPMLFGDETRIKQVITNLLTNAIKYTEEGSVILRYGGEMTPSGKFMLQIEVEDTGIGIRRENVQYVFDSFRRVEGEDTKNIEGTGLGLAITKELVELMGGTISVNSIYTKGSTFRVEIPQEIVDDASKYFKSPGILAREQPKYQQSFEAPNASVLIVDDNDLNRIVCRKLLRSTKVQVDMAASGQECLDKTREHHYDAIFMDHEMPQMDGIETLQKLRQQTDGLCRETPVIALTANAGSDRNAFYLEQGFSAYLSKPIQSSRLEALLLACLPPDLVDRSYLESNEETVHISESLQKRPFIVSTDSICDLPEHLLKEYDILVMPYYIETPHGRFRDQQEINADNLQQLMAASNQAATTSPAPVEEYEVFFGNALAEARMVLHLSSASSATQAFHNALDASDSFGNVYVMDSGQISSGLGMMCIRAVELLRSGLRLEDTIQELERYQKRIQLNYLIPALSRSRTKYRIPVLTKFLTDVLNWEPIFTVRRKKLRIRRFVLGYVRSTPDQFVRFCLLRKRNINTKRLFVTFSGCPMEKREHVMQQIVRYSKFDEIIVNKSSAVTFSNCGPEAIGLIYENEDRSQAM